MRLQLTEEGEFILKKDLEKLLTRLWLKLHRLYFIKRWYYEKSLDSEYIKPKLCLDVLLRR